MKQMKEKLERKFLLPLDIQFFASEGAEGGEEDNGVNEGDSGSWVDDILRSDKSKETMIPKKRFDDINNRYKTLSDDYKNRQAEYDEMTKKLEESSASYKELEKTVQAGTERIKTLESVLKTMFDAELEQIDEEYRELVPADKPIEQQLEWLAKAKAKGLFGTKSLEFEIGQMSNPRQSSKGVKAYDNMNPLQLLTMGYSK